MKTGETSASGTPSAGRSAESLRADLVETLEQGGYIRSSAVREAFLRVPRELFVPEVARREGLSAVYADRVLVIRTGAHGMALSSSSQPAIMAEMLEQLALEPGLRVLEMGTGSGYNAALLSQVVGPTGEVTTIELEPDLAAAADDALRGGGYWVTGITGDAHTALEGLRHAYDRIIVTASSDHVPESWRDALVDGGRLVMPLRLPRSAEGDQAVVTFERRGAVLSSVAVVPGGFMNLRRPGDTDALPVRFAHLSVSEFIGVPRTIASLQGSGLARMSGAARRRLVTLMLDRPRIGGVATPRPARDSLISYLHLAGGNGGGVNVRTHRPAGPDQVRVGVGVASLDGRGLALIVERSARRGARVEVYGSGSAAASAEETLRRLVGKWRDAGCPSLADCRITVRFEPKARIRFEWSRPDPTGMR